MTDNPLAQNMCDIASAEPICYDLPVRKKQKRCQSICDVMRGACADLRTKMGQYELWERWSDIVGPAIAQHAQPSSWRRTTLVVRVDHHAWMQELHFMRANIIDRIRRVCPKTAIQDIRFELGRSGSFTSPESRQPDDSPQVSPALSRAEREFARDTVQPIADEETRAAIRRLIEKDLSLKKARTTRQTSPKNSEST